MTVRKLELRAGDRVLFIARAGHPTLTAFSIVLRGHRPDLLYDLLVDEPRYCKGIDLRCFDSVRPVLGDRQLEAYKAVVVFNNDPMPVLRARLHRGLRLIYFLPTLSGLKMWKEALRVCALRAADAVVCTAPESTRRLCGVAAYSGVVGCLPEFEPSSMPKLSANDGQYHLGYAGMVMKRNSAPCVPKCYLDVEKCRQVTAQRIHLHIHPLYSEFEAPEWRCYKQLQHTGFFHLEPALPYMKLLCTMTRYDAAWRHCDFSLLPRRRWPGGRISGAFVANLQAGLPMVTSPGSDPAELSVARANGLNIMVHDIGRMKAALDSCDFSALGRHIQEVKTVLFQENRERIKELLR